MMARNETIDALEKNRTSFIVVNALTDSNQGIIEFDIVECPLRGWSVAEMQMIIVHGHIRKAV